MLNHRVAVQQLLKSQSKAHFTNNICRDPSGKDKENDEEQKMQDALSSAIVREKPNVKWTDVAGLDQAKASL